MYSWYNYAWSYSWSSYIIYMHKTEDCHDFFLFELGHMKKGSPIIYCMDVVKMFPNVEVVLMKSVKLIISILLCILTIIIIII